MEAHWLKAAVLMQKMEIQRRSLMKRKQKVTFLLEKKVNGCDDILYSVIPISAYNNVGKRKDKRRAW